MKHNITLDKYSDAGKEITEQEYEDGKARLQEIGRLSRAVYEGAIPMDDVPADMRAKVTETVEVMRRPPAEEEAMEDAK